MCLFTIIFIFVFNLHLHWSANSHWHSIQCRPPHPPRSLPSRLLWCRRRRQMVCRPAVNTITAPTQGVFMTVGTFLFTSIPFQCLAQTQQRGAHIWPIWGPCLLHNNVHKVSLFETPCCITTTQSGNGPQTCPMGHKNGSLGARQKYKVRGRWRGCTQRPTQWRVPASLELTEFGGIPSEESCGAWPWKLKNKFRGQEGALADWRQVPPETP